MSRGCAAMWFISARAPLLRTHDPLSATSTGWTSARRPAGDGLARAPATTAVRVGYRSGPRASVACSRAKQGSARPFAERGSASSEAQSARPACTPSRTRPFEIGSPSGSRWGAAGDGAHDRRRKKSGEAGRSRRGAVATERLAPDSGTAVDPELAAAVRRGSTRASARTSSRSAAPVVAEFHAPQSTRRARCANRGRRRCRERGRRAAATWPCGPVQFRPDDVGVVSTVSRRPGAIRKTVTRRPPRGQARVHGPTRVTERGGPPRACPHERGIEAASGGAGHSSTGVRGRTPRAVSSFQPSPERGDPEPSRRRRGDSRLLAHDA